MIDFASIFNCNFVAHKRKFKVTDLFDKMRQLFAVKCDQKKISLDFECPDDLAMVSDFNKICGCLFNFLDNSVKFTQKGGIKLQAILEQSMVSFKIVDTGVGIDEVDFTKIS